MKRHVLRAVSLVELVVVVAILGLVAALAIPRMGRAAAGDPERAVRHGLDVLRIAVERYRQDHHAYPGQLGDGHAPAGSPAAFVAQLTRFTDADGATSAERSARFRFGPYLRQGVPACPLAPPETRTTVHLTDGDAAPTPAPASTPDSDYVGWLFNYRTGEITVCTDDIDTRGRRYDSY